MTSTMLKQEQNYFVRHTRAIISLSGNSGPIDLSIMAVSSECYLQRLEEKSIALSFALSLSLKTFNCYFDDSHTRFENRQKSLQFFEISNKKDSSIQYIQYLKAIKRNLIS